MSLKSSLINKKNINFSVAICVYKNDNPNFFREALESVINQTVAPDEIVLVVDGPVSNSTDEVIKKYEKEHFFKVIRLSKNVGHGNARRIGLENCSNELIALMDSDDVSVENRFELQLKCFSENERLEVCGGYIKEFMHDIDNIVSSRKVPSEDYLIKEYMKKRCPFNQVTVMFKKSAVESVGGYIDWHHEEDYYLWIRMAQSQCTFRNLKNTLVFVRVGEDMYKRRGGLKYFVSETKLQQYMLKNKIINRNLYLQNVAVRFVIQILLPHKIRGVVFKKFARN